MSSTFLIKIFVLEFYLAISYFNMRIISFQKIQIRDVTISRSRFHKDNLRHHPRFPLISLAYNRFSLCLYLLQTHFGISSFSHTDNALELCGLLTPLHIVPEWYFLCQYAMLKAVPNNYSVSV